MIYSILTASSGNEVKDDFSNFLKNSSIFICVGLVLLIGLVILIIVLKKKTNPNEKQIEDFDGNSLVDALGGIDNIQEVSRTGSRITVKLHNTSIINNEKLKENGIDNIVAMSEKITLVVNNNPENIEQLIKNVLQ